jgi:glycosyltransferase involved in cell wall biosynthesis
MRVPRLGEGKVFFKRIGRKLGSLRRGLVRVRERFFVFSPIAAPGPLGATLNRWALPSQIRRAAQKAGMRTPLLWVACPPGAEVVERLPHAGLVYQRTDRYEAFGGVEPDRISRYDRFLKKAADLTVFCSRALKDEEAAACREAAYVDHGVDFERFESAGAGTGAEPADVASLPRPRIGFVGGIDRHTFDPELFIEVARKCPDMSFVLVGGCSLPEGWCPLPNVSLLGRRDYSEVAAYMAACDALIMPWNASDWIRACNPVKLKEYLAVGRPVISTPFDELHAYFGLVRIARDAGEFANAIREAIAGVTDVEAGRDRVRHQTWTAKAEAVRQALACRGVRMMAGPQGT